MQKKGRRDYDAPLLMLSPPRRKLRVRDRESAFFSEQLKVVVS